MRTRHGRILGSERALPAAASLLLGLTVMFGCAASDPPRSNNGQGGEGGSGDTGGEGGSPTAGRGGGGGSGGTGGGAGKDAAATPERDASVNPATPDAGGPPDTAVADMATGTPADTGSAPSADGGPPAMTRPNEPGDPCKVGTRYAFTVTRFAQPQTGVFTAWFSATPSKARTNSVVVLTEDNPNRQDPPHNVSQILVRFAEGGQLDVRNGTAYHSDTVIRYEPIQYDFRLVVDVPAHKYAAYVSWKGQPEVTLGTNLAFRDNTAVPTKFDHWGVEAVASDMTRVCGFLVKAH